VVCNIRDLEQILTGATGYRNAAEKAVIIGTCALGRSILTAIRSLRTARAVQEFLVLKIGWKKQQ
jgi:hypothetical protein